MRALVPIRIEVERKLKNIRTITFRSQDHRITIERKTIGGVVLLNETAGIPVNRSWVSC